ncbi:MAG TPA: hypothetical protein PLE35_03955 [Lentisphaeria bacterium]|nr:hypothetical protein [Lentisphaeria bacterium]
MRRIIAIAAVIAALLTAIAAPAQQKRGDKAPRRGEQQQKAKASKNLIVNGDLEDGGGKSPKGWSAVDGMMSSWGNEGNPGRCLVFDTSVLQVDKKKYLTAEEEFKGRGNTSKKNQYETVGAHEGVWAFSAPIEIKPDDQYFVLSADVWAPAKSTELFAPMIFIRGFTSVKADEAGQASSYFHVPHEGGPAYGEMFGPDKNHRPSREGDYLMVYRHTLTCRVVKPNTWRHFELGFKLPSMARFRPERIWIKPYAFWPLGVYKFDNLSLRRSTKAEVDEVNRRRPSIKELDE